MGLSDDDVTEILRIIDRAGPAEVTVRTRGSSCTCVVTLGRRERKRRRPRHQLLPPLPRPPPPPSTHPCSASSTSPTLPGAAVRRGRSAVEPDTVVGIIEVMKMMNTSRPASAGRSSRSAWRTPSSSRTARRSSRSPPREPVIDFVDNDHPRRQPEPLGRDRADDPRGARDRPDDRPRRLSRAGLHLEHPHGGLGALPPSEDPWERIRRMSEAMPDTLLTFLTTGMRFISWEPATEDVIRLVFRTVVRNGLRRVQIAEPMNDPAALAQIARLAKEEGAEEVVVCLTYSRSPVHDDEHYATRAAAMGRCPDVDRLYLKDPGGLVTVERLRELAPLFIDGFAGRGPVELHSHCTISLAPQAYVEGAQLGFDVLHTAVGPDGQRHLAARGGDDDPQPRGRRLRASARPRRPARDLGALPRAGAGQGPEARHADRVRRHLLPASGPGRRDDHDEPAARGDAPPRALRRGDRGDRARARGLRLPDRRHAYAQFLVTQAVFNVMARHRGPSATPTSPTRSSATSSGTSATRRRRPTPTWPTACSPRRARPSCARWSRSASRARARSSGRRSPTRSCSCG